MFFVFLETPALAKSIPLATLPESISELQETEKFRVCRVGTWDTKSGKAHRHPPPSNLLRPIPTSSDQRTCPDVEGNDALFYFGPSSESD